MCRGLSSRLDRHGWRSPRPSTPDGRCTCQPCTCRGSCTRPGTTSGSSRAHASQGGNGRSHCSRSRCWSSPKGRHLSRRGETIGCGQKQQRRGDARAWDIRILCTRRRVVWGMTERQILTEGAVIVGEARIALAFAVVARAMTRTTMRASTLRTNASARAVEGGDLEAGEG